ncbi:2-keto-4-pentenoate hydratase [Zavarzinia sp. CC-PAN008]|uniref:2-keto-4-pentenoate hydratase n=1 Tax=Zavarzinia sp. CC-PAN008 TaxID=3243332 RepID=UPI003F745598
MSGLDSALVARAADALAQARRDRMAIAPLGPSMGLTDVATAYAVQEHNTARWLAEGRRIVGRKIGLTSKAVQVQLGVDQPDYGMLWADWAFAEGEAIPAGRMIQPKAEAEIAFVMDRALDDPQASLADVMRAIAYCVAAVEVVDSAIADWKITLADTVADNASGAGFVLGTGPRRITDVDLRLCGMVMARNGETVSTGVGAACLGHPLNATLWLARTMAQAGRPLQPGDIVLSGALGPMTNVVAGDRVHVEIQGFAPLSLTFGP